ncbi:MAG: NAD(P) transhydrogenase subunit alpha [Gammaproteobacteria bacterium]
MIEGLPALYIFMLSAFTGYEVISRVPVILHTPLMSGSNFVHGIVVVGAMIVMGNAEGALELTIGFIAVAMAAGNAVGGYVATIRMLEMFQHKPKPTAGSQGEA